MATVLKIEDLHKSFKTGFLLRKKKILKGISLTVEEGQIFGYLGPNGAGKTTTLKCILGLLFPEKGKIELFGLPHLSLRAKERIGFLPENPYFYEHLTASEFLNFYGELSLKKKKDIAARVKELLHLVGLEPWANMPLRKFSRGMLQRIGFAQSLFNEPSLVLLDEPLGGLDPLGRKEMRDIIARLKQEGKTVFLSSHILQDIEMICDRVAIIINGQIHSQGTLHDLVSEKILFTEIILSGLKSNELKSLGERFSYLGEKTLLKVFEEDKIDTIIDLVQKKNGKIHSLIPRTQTLEDLFVGMVKKG
ncbi:MAG: ATP-binding cassette domain-containing protein [Candidatus Aminicenantes bacterium]|nr:ATP-binding cassette domain-containing protein [Candidatus Aminicenantes bacterium]